MSKWEVPTIAPKWGAVMAQEKELSMVSKKKEVKAFDKPKAGMPDLNRWLAHAEEKLIQNFQEVVVRSWMKAKLMELAISKFSHCLKTKEIAKRVDRVIGMLRYEGQGNVPSISTELAMELLAQIQVLDEDASEEY